MLAVMKSWKALCLAALLPLAACGGSRATSAAPEIAALPAPAWNEAAVADLAEAARQAAREGLPSEEATLNEIAALQNRGARDAGAVEMLDQTAEALFRRLAVEFAHGATDPARVANDWHIPRAPAPDLEALSQARLAGAAPSVQLAALKPQSEEYQALSTEYVRVLAEPANTEDANGRSRGDRLDSMRASLERWRWMPRDMPSERVEVRIPHFEAVYRGVNGNETHAVIVGARRTPTPVFSVSIEAVTLNPTWTPPQSIVSNELLPRFRRNPGAAAAENFEVLDSSGRAVPLSDVNWHARPFPYTLRQRAGAGNALGQLKFEMPNAYDVYLHDTSAPGLFERANRALSHGCIRVQDPAGLASAVLGLDLASLQSEIDQGATQRLPLAAPLQVYVLYMTAVADGGVVRYADDLYHADGAVLTALDSPDLRLMTSNTRTQQPCAS